MSTINNVVLKSMVYNGQIVKKWNHDGVQVFSAGSTVTYICAGNAITEEVDSGASVLSPKSFTPTLAGATFKGWSKSPNSATVETSLVMGSEPIVLYAVFKYNDTSVSMAEFWQGGDTDIGTGIGGAVVTNIASVDFAKYYALTFNYSAYVGQNYLGCTVHVTTSCGGASSNLVTQWNYGGGPWDEEDKQENRTNRASGSKTLTFTSTSGIGACKTTTTGDGSCCGAGATFSGAKLLGRTVVG